MSKDKQTIDAPELLQRLERMARLMRADGHAGGLNPVQWEALRYLSRCNRFSNSPIALAKYLGSTKGTVSQTVKSLEKKELAVKATREGERRSVSLTLTDKGHAALGDDPTAELLKTLDALGGKTRRRLAKGLQDILNAETQRRRMQEFGTCPDCRFFREKTGESYYCMHFDAALAEKETSLICVTHLSR
jgi:DNA-binding MarR family transcriptional regulator